MRQMARFRLSQKVHRSMQHGPDAPRSRRPREKSRLLGGFSGTARVDAPSAPMKPQVTAVPLFGVLGVPGRKHPIDDFYIWGPPCAADAGPAHGAGSRLAGRKAASPVWAVEPPPEFEMEKGRLPASGKCPVEYAHQIRLCPPNSYLSLQNSMSTSSLRANITSCLTPGAGSSSKGPSTTSSHQTAAASRSSV